jgi:hypothetical protein
MRPCSARRKFDTSVIREAIEAAVKAHGAGKILPSEMPIESETRDGFVRYAPSFSACVTESVTHPYTVESLAKFLGFVNAKSETATNSFITAFGAEELIADGVLKESQIRGLSAERLGELVISLRKQRGAAKAARLGYLNRRSVLTRIKFRLHTSDCFRKKSDVR